MSAIAPSIRPIPYTESRQFLDHHFQIVKRTLGNLFSAIARQEECNLFFLLNSTIVELRPTSEDEKKAGSTENSSFERAAQCARIFFKTVVTREERGLEAFISQTTIESFVVSMRQIGATPILIQSYLPEDLNAFGIQEDEVQVEAPRLSCLAYALLKARALEAKRSIFIDASFCVRMFNNHEKFLNLLKYKLTKSDPQEGDLILYFDRSQLVHVGLYNARGRVDSKFGDQNPYAYEHDLIDVLPQYGNHYKVYRKFEERRS